MRLKSKNRIVAVTLLLSLLAASCGTRDNPGPVSGVEEGQTERASSGTSGGTEASGEDDSGITAVADFRYLESDILIESVFEESYTMNGDWLYMTVSEGNAEKDGENYFGIARKQLSDGYQEKNYVMTDIEDDGYNKLLLLADKAGNCYLYWRLRDWDEGGVQSYVLEKYGTDGSLLWRNELDPNALEGMAEMLEQGVVTEDGRVLLYSYGEEGHVFCFGEDGSLEKVYVPEVESLEGIVIGKDDRLYGYNVTGREPVFIELEGEQYVCPVAPLAVYSGYDGGIFLKTGEGLLRYEPETAETEELWEWEDEFIQLDENLVDQFFQADGVFTLLCLEGLPLATKKQILTVVSLTLEEGRKRPDRQTVILAADALTTETQTLVQMYNRQSEKYRVEIQVTGSGSALQTQLLRGDGADLMEVQRIYRNDLVRQGAFEDLDPYYEGSTVVDQEDILKSVREIGTIGGINAVVIPDFRLKTMRIREADALDGDWTIWKFLELGTERKMFSSQSPMAALNYCMGLQYGSHFVDYENRTCSFDGEEFRRVLEACGKWGQHTYRDDSGYQVDGSSAEGDWLLEYKYISSVWDLIPYEPSHYEEAGALNASDYSATFIGYPGWEGGENAFEAMVMYAINSASKNKEGAWDFLEYLLSPDMQGKIGQIMDTMPVREECFEGLLNDTYYSPKLAQRVAEPTKEDIGRMREMVSSAVMEDHNTGYNPIAVIVSEEAGMYFAGDSALDDTVRMIQSRVQLYLDEQ